MTKAKILRITIVLAIIVAMVAMSQLLAIPQIIFPEAAALSVGAIYLAKDDWIESPWKLAILPPLASLIGVLSIRAGLPNSISVPVLFCLIVISLRLLKSELFPTISAGVLPLIFRISTLYFPISVLIISLLITLISQLLKQSPNGSIQTLHQSVPSDRQLNTTAIVYSAIVLIWILFAWNFLPKVSIAPPLFVSFYDWFSSNDQSHRRLLRRFTSIITAATIGEVAIHLFPRPLSALVAVAVTWAIITLLEDLHPPTLAISLLPLILPNLKAFTFVAGVGVTTICLGAIGVEVKRLAKWRSWPL